MFDNSEFLQRHENTFDGRDRRSRGHRAMTHHMKGLGNKHEEKSIDKL